MSPEFRKTCDMVMAWYAEHRDDYDDAGQRVYHEEPPMVTAVREALEKDAASGDFVAPQNDMETRTLSTELNDWVARQRDDEEQERIRQARDHAEVIFRPSKDEG